MLVQREANHSNLPSTETADDEALLRAYMACLKRKTSLIPPTLPLQEEMEKKKLPMLDDVHAWLTDHLGQKTLVGMRRY